MIVVWTGHGILILLLGVAGLFTGNVLSGQIFPSMPDAFEPLPGVWGAAVFVGLYALSFGKAQQMYDGRKARNAHTLFFVPAKYWAMLLFGYAALVTGVRVASHQDAARVGRIQEISNDEGVLPTEVRVWTDRAGRTVDASLVEIRGTASDLRGVFRKRDGAEFEHRFSMFSEADRTYLEGIAKRR